MVLVGDSGVGKTGLGLALTGQPFVPTESSHGRSVWLFESLEDDLGQGRKQTRETLLWDLAGQPGYRLIHQLHLNEVAVALVVFDARSEVDPFAGVRHWDRALRQARRVQGSTAPPLTKCLVAARTERDGIGVSQERIKALSREMEFDSYFETSAKEGRGIADLSTAIRQAIDWEQMPKVSSTELFQTIKSFLIDEKSSGRLLSTSSDLLKAFMCHSINRGVDEKNLGDGKSLWSKISKTFSISGTSKTVTGEDLLRQGLSSEELDVIEKLKSTFDTCIGRVESRGLIQRLGFGDLILLQPELLDAYASAIVNAAKEEPEGLGCMAEEEARLGRFRLPQDERITDSEQEKLLLIATIEDMLSHEICLREPSNLGSDLVFPTQLTREREDLPDPEGKAVVFTFEGPVINIYATLTVRLAHSGLFAKNELWKNAATYQAKIGGTCGLVLREFGQGRGGLTLFFDPAASEETRYQFEEYVQTHLQRRALPETITRRRIFVCPDCDIPISDMAAAKRRELGHDTILCNVCETRIPLLDREERLTAAITSAVPEMDRAADERRDLETAKSIRQGKKATNDFDVFLCHNTEDKAAVKEYGELLKKKGLLPWLDEWELRPGVPRQELLEDQIKNIKSAAIFVGKSGLGPWQKRELRAFLHEFVNRGCPVIPLILPGVKRKPKLPIFLQGMGWVDARKTDPDPLQHLIWGITGKKGG